MDLSKELLKGDYSVTYITGPIAGGKTTICVHLARMFADQGLDVAFTSLHRSVGDLEQLVNHSGVSYFSMSLGPPVMEMLRGRYGVVFVDSPDYHIDPHYFQNCHVFYTEQFSRGCPRDFWSVRPDIFASYFKYENQILVSDYSSIYNPSFFYKNKHGVRVFPYVRPS